RPDLVDEFVSQGGHDYRPDLRMAVFKWINKHMRGNTGSITDSAEFKPLPGKDLRVFADEKDIPSDAINLKIDETFVAKASVALPQPSSFNKWKQERLKELRAHSFRPFPDQLPTAKRGDQVKETKESKDSKPRARPASSKVVTEQGIEVVLRSLSNARVRSATVIVLNSGEAWAESDRPPEWARSYASGAAAALLPRGVAAGWTQKTPPNYVERAHVLLGRTIDEGRVWDIVTTMRMLQEEAKLEKRTFRLVGRGQAGVLCAYAALFEPSIR